MAEKLRRQVKRSCEEQGRGKKRRASAHELGAGRKAERPGKAEGVTILISRVTGIP